MILLSAHHRKPQRTTHPLTQVRLDGDDVERHDIKTRLLQESKSSSSLPSSQIELHTLRNSKNMAKPDVTTLASPATRTTTKNKQRNSKHVKFGYICIREHSVTVGEHDWCEGGLPITLDWQHAETKSIGVEDFEWIRERQGRTPRGCLPKLDMSERKRLLRRVAGITEEDLFLMERQGIESKYLKLRRSKTVTLHPTHSDNLSQ